MKKLFAFCILAGRFFVFAAEPADGPFDRAACLKLKPGEVEVVVPKDASPVERFAGAEMTNFLSRAFGRAVPLVCEGGAAGMPHQRGEGARTPILLGRAAVRKAGIDVRSLARDAFSLRVTADGAVALAGRDDLRRDPVREMVNGTPLRFERGTVMGVYAFLEKFAGCRFYFPGELGECVPRVDSIDVPASWDVKPAWTVRRWYEGQDCRWFEGGADERKVRARANALNIMRLRMETEVTPCCHGETALDFIGRFGKSHPEYFTKLTDGTRFNRPGSSECSRYGQICYSSGAMEELYQDVKAYLTGQPASSRGLKRWGHNCVNRHYVDIMPSDGFTPCQCGKCEPRFNKAHPSQYASEMVWGETAKIANRLSSEGIPGYVTQMAYCSYRRIPDVDIPTNVLVMVAEQGPWAKVNPKELAREKEEIRSWAEKLKRPVWIWTYPGKHMYHAFPGIPNHSPRAVGEFYKLVSPWIFGTFMEGESDRFLYVHLNYYMLSRVGWDTEVDVEATLAEYYRLMFGPAADAVKAFFEGLEDRWVCHIMGNVVDTEIGPKATPPSEAQIWGEIYSKATLDGWRASLERARDVCGRASLEGRRVQLFLDEFLKPLEEQSAGYLARRARIAALKFPSAEEPEAMILKPFKVKEGATPVKTTVRIVRRADALVVSYDCEEPQMRETRCPKLVHDHKDIWKCNNVEFFLNIAGDRRSYYHLIVTEKGDLQDLFDVQAGSGRSMPVCDEKWESHAQVKVGKSATGWTAEIAIPLSSFREPVPASFPANFYRGRALEDGSLHQYSWSPYVLGFHDPNAFGVVTPMSAGAGGSAQTESE